MYLRFNLTSAPELDHDIEGVFGSAPRELPTCRRSENTAATWRLPHQPEAAGEARRLAGGAVRAWGVDEGVVDSLVLAVSELVTNAVEHARPPIALHVHHVHAKHTLHIEVSDGGPAACGGERAQSCAPEEHGRGIVIVDALASAHGNYSTSPGSTWWADLPADDA